MCFHLHLPVVAVMTMPLKTILPCWMVRWPPYNASLLCVNTTIAFCWSVNTSTADSRMLLMYPAGLVISIASLSHLMTLAHRPKPQQLAGQATQPLFQSCPSPPRQDCMATARRPNPPRLMPNLHQLHRDPHNPWHQLHRDPHNPRPVTGLYVQTAPLVRSFTHASRPLLQAPQAADPTCGSASSAP